MSDRRPDEPRRHSAWRSGLRRSWLRRVPRQDRSERPEDTSDEEGRLVVRGVDEPPGGDGCDERPRQADAREEGNGRRGDGWLD